MGSERGQPDEAPVHEVSVGPFAIDKYEMTQDQLAALAIPNPSQFKGPRRPIEQVRWADAALLANARSRADGLEPCYDEDSFECNFEATGYRLPTEAEWEYACRTSARGAGQYGFRGGEAKLRSYACYAGSSGKKTEPVGRRKPNAWGLHDMYGNVLEWCHDIYAPDYYQQSPSRDPRGPTGGKHRVLRGGSWASNADGCRPTRRWHDNPGTTDACFARSTYGFRCVRALTRAEREQLERKGEGE